MQLRACLPQLKRGCDDTLALVGVDTGRIEVDADEELSAGSIGGKVEREGFVFAIAADPLVEGVEEVVMDVGYRNLGEAFDEGL